MIRSMPLRGSSRATLRMLVIPSANRGSGRPAANASQSTPLPITVLRKAT